MFRSRLLVIALLSFALMVPGPLAALAARSNLAERPKRNLLVVRHVDTMSEYTRELAEQLEILPFLEELRNKEHPVEEKRRALLRDKIFETIIESYFDAQSFIAEAQREEMRLQNWQQRLTSQREHRVDTTNAMNFMTSGTLNTVGSALVIAPSANPVAGGINSVLAGVVSTGLSIYAMKQSKSGRTSGWGKPTVLADLFGRPTDNLTAYPESIWRFFHCTMPGHAKIMRAEYLERMWRNRGALEPDGSPREQHKIDLVCGLSSDRNDMTLRDISDQIDMVADVSAAAAQMIHFLRNLLQMIDSDL